MIDSRQGLFCFILLGCLFLSPACRVSEQSPPLFEVMDESHTGLHFSNRLRSTEQFNLFKYMYFYNGAGIGAGDFNNDGRIDLFFASNQGENRLYLNTGNLQFKDITQGTRIPQDGGWSTGVSVVDINHDGLLDIYVCRVGKHETLQSRNQLLICGGLDQNGVPFYTDRAAEYGLNFSGFSTQAVFFDYDLDGDLDMYLLNHSIHENGNFDLRAPLLAQSSPVSGDRLYRNNGEGPFTDVTKEAGINSSIIGYGLGVVVSDINMDGYPDLYIGNDFHENDYLYLNQRNGTFKEDLTSQIMHTSRYTMGVDAADLNNDGYPEIVSTDMLPGDPAYLKRSPGEGDFEIADLKLAYGYNNQYMRNNLQYNRRNGLFSEVGLYAGIAATDWSWAPLLVDFDNDGLKDLFITNGIPKRMNDIDYINYISNDEMQKMIRGNNMDETNMALIDKFPEIKIPNKLYKNTGKLSFADLASRIKNDKPTYSNGAAYADFDNDGDQDIVVNNIGEPAFLYRNNTNDTRPRDFLDITLKGPRLNVNALGSKIILFSKGHMYTHEKFPVRGFLSSMESPVHIGLDSMIIDSMVIVWPDNTYEPLKVPEQSSTSTVHYKPGLPSFNYNQIQKQSLDSAVNMADISAAAGLNYFHKENSFVEYAREPLIPHMVSREGPALATGDFNQDGLEDVFFGSAKGEKSAVFVQDKKGHFSISPQPALNADSMYEDVDACWIDVNKDGLPDLVAASGGNEFYGQDQHMSPRVYLNKGRSKLERLPDAFNNIYLTASCIAPHDFNGDGFVDLFIGGRAVPWAYGQVPASYLLQNDGTGKFRDVTSNWSADLVKPGFVTGAVWFDIDKDGKKDLIACYEWGGIDAFTSSGKSFTKRPITGKLGWWNFILPVDVNNDGLTDLLAGNLGLNTRLGASDKEPVNLYYYDFDGNGTREQLLTYFVSGREIPFAGKAELEKQVPGLRKRFLLAKDFANATLNDLFTNENIKKAANSQANYFASAIFINKGGMQFEAQALPWEAQLSPYKDAMVVDVNHDDLQDIMLVGNFYDNNIEMGRYDADFGTILVNRGKGVFDCKSISGIQLKGQVRRIKEIVMANKKSAFILARNNDRAMVIQPVAR